MSSQFLQPMIDDDLFSPNGLGAELFPDSDMEAVGVAGWFVSGMTIEKSTDEAHSPVQSLKGHTAAGTAYKVITVAAGKTYRITGWQIGDDCSLWVYDASNGAWLWQPAYSNKLAWTELTQDIVMPVGCIAIRVYLRTNSAVTAYADDYSVREVL